MGRSGPGRSTECRILGMRNSPHRYQPFAFTAFSP